MVFDKQIIKLLATVLFISALAGLSIYYDNKNTIVEYENIPVFKDFQKNIDNISVIKLENNKTTLTFIRKDNVWSLKEYPELPVYQERIRSFLVSLNNMTFYEKKSDKAEDLKYFGLSSLKDKNSPTIEVTLSNAQNVALEKFDIGWYDFDLGRGAKAAYIRLDNQFQVWLVNVDFYDLSLDKNDWTYSTLWNLRFGRFIRYNGINTDAKVMELVKDLLNTPILSVIADVKAKKIASINMIVENNNEIELEFFEADEQKYYAKYYFIKQPKGKHLEFFSKYIKGMYLEISKEAWEKIKNDL